MWYTCGLNENEGVWTTWAKTCHKDHVFVYWKISVLSFMTVNLNLNVFDFQMSLKSNHRKTKLLGQASTLIAYILIKTPWSRDGFRGGNIRGLRGS